MTENLTAQWTHLEELPASEHEETGVTRTESPPSDALEWHQSVSELFGTGPLYVAVGALAPGKAAPMHAHDPPIEEYYLILEGTVTLEVNDPETGTCRTVTEAPAGTLAHFPPGLEHRPKNITDSRALVLDVRLSEELSNLDGQFDLRPSGES